MTTDVEKSKLLHYRLLTEFKRQYFRDLLDVEHLTSGLITIKGMQVLNNEGNVIGEGSFAGYSLEKDELRYLLSSDVGETRVNLRELLPIKVFQSQPVSHKGLVYAHIQESESRVFKSEPKMTFKQLVDTLCLLKHTNPDHQKVMMFIALASAIDRLNFRVATNSGFGKDSSVTTMNSLIGKCQAVVSPSSAKLSYLTQSKWLVVSEVIGLGKEDQTIIEQFLLMVGDLKPEFVKSKRAESKSKETLNIEALSLSIFYNQVDEYPEARKVYIDYAAKAAMLNRFPPLRLHGTFDGAANNIDSIDSEEAVKNNWEFYTDIISTLTHYKNNVRGRIPKRWERVTRHMRSDRWRTNFDVLFKYVDLYCDTQEEFSKWEKIVYDALDDYQEMLLYPDALISVEKRLSQKELFGVTEKLHQFKTFKEKNNYLRKVATGETDYSETNSPTKWF